MPRKAGHRIYQELPQKLYTTFLVTQGLYVEVRVNTKYIPVLQFIYGRIPA
jgi:hypothetical protein